jgi:hypothetical protein
MAYSKPEWNLELIKEDERTFLRCKHTGVLAEVAQDKVIWHCEEIAEEGEGSGQMVA